MDAVKYETIITADHRLRIDLPPSFPEGEAEVIVLAKSAREKEKQAGESLEEFLDWIKTLPPTGRSVAEIEAQIAEERASWGND